MNIEELRSYCLNKPGTTEDMPFDETTLVFKVMGKMFALTDLEEDLAVNLKASPDEIPRLIEQYEAVGPGYHMNKKHWITVSIDGSIPLETIQSWIDTSYNLVTNNLTKKEKAELNAIKHKFN
jgi:predicted DNA-binding protein (MmcQ/YjbR family)